MTTKQATHVTPTDTSSIQIMAADAGGFIVLTNCSNVFEGNRDPTQYVGRSGACFSTAEECGAWVASVLKNISHRKFGPKGPRS